MFSQRKNQSAYAQAPQPTGRYASFLYVTGMALAGVVLFVTGVPQAQDVGVLLFAAAVIGVLSLINTLLGRSSKRNSDFITIDGIGTTLYRWGSKQFAHEWVVVLFIPVFPIATYEVFNKEDIGIFSRRYRLREVPFNHRQALAVYGIYAAIALVAILR